jgi:hypothetical protein
MICRRVAAGFRHVVKLGKNAGMFFILQRSKTPWAGNKNALVKPTPRIWKIVSGE